MVEQQELPFLDLPAALVEEVLGETRQVAESLLLAFQSLREERTHLRDGLKEAGLVMHESRLPYPPLPTTCGVDGSYAIERLLSLDLAACAAVAVEGLVPPSNLRHWELPHHLVFVRAEAHDPDTATVLRAVMMGYEMLLSTRAPHDVVMLDATLTLPIIYFNQALNQAPQSPRLQCSEEFLERCPEFLDAYRSVLRPPRSDKNFVGLPKYSTRREIGRRLGWSHLHDDRGLLTFLLEPGEFTTPLPLEQPTQAWHLAVHSLPVTLHGDAAERAEDIVAALQQVRVTYYRPHHWLPALRLEVPAAVAENHYRLATVIQGVKHQCATPGMLEPYPLYLADRTARAVARAMPSFRQVTAQQLAERYEGDIGEVFFGMHGYRSESGG